MGYKGVDSIEARLYLFNSKENTMDQEMYHTDEHLHAGPQPGGAPEGTVLWLTDVAGEKVNEVLAREGLTQGGLRVSVVGGGCSGFQYNLSLDPGAHDDDTLIAPGGANIFDDPI